MSSPVSTFGPREADEKGARTAWPLLRAVQQRPRLALLLAAAVVVVVGWVLYDRPAHTYPMSGNSATWSADVRIALSEGGAGGVVAPSGPLREIPGVGRIVEVIIDKATLRKSTEVLFLTGTNANYSGLAYLNGFPPPPDSCNVHLGGPWWQLASLNVQTMGCQRGFHFTGAP